jgi:DNA recombination protein RmuC
MILYILIGVFGGSLLTLILALLISRSNAKKKRDLQTEVAQLGSDNERLKQDLIQTRDDYQHKNEEWIALGKELSARNQEISQLKRINEEKEKDLKETLDRMNREFKILANDLLEEKTKKLTDQNVERLKEILTPLKDQISGFEKRVDETYKSSIKDQSDLRAELKKTPGSQSENIERSQQPD